MRKTQSKNVCGKNMSRRFIQVNIVNQIEVVRAVSTLCSGALPWARVPLELRCGAIISLAVKATT